MLGGNDAGLAWIACKTHVAQSTVAGVCESILTCLFAQAHTHNSLQKV